jgi:hypothetical protein
MQCTPFRAKSAKNNLKPTDFLKRNFYFEMEGVHHTCLSDTNIGYVPCSHLFGFAPHLLMCLCKRDLLTCYAPRFIKCVMHQDLWNVLCTRSTNVLCTLYINVFCNEINGYELVNAHNYFIQIMHVIKWSSSLSM